MKCRRCASHTIAKKRLTEGPGELKAGRVDGSFDSVVEISTRLHKRAL
jgi:hypothetical protein